MRTDQLLSPGLQKFFQPYLFFPSEERIMELVIPHLKGNCILDAGCGSGWLSICAWEMGCHVISLDVAHSEIKKSLFISKQKNTDIKLTKASLTDLPFCNSIFDSIMCISVLEHIYDVKKAISEISRVLKENGRLIIMVPNGITFGLLYDRIVYKFIPAKLRMSRVHKKMYSLEEHEISALGLNEEPIGHCQQFTITSLQKLLDQQGFKIVNVINCRFLSPFIRSLCTLLGRSPVVAFERLDNRIVDYIPSITASEWVIICDKVRDRDG